MIVLAKSFVEMVGDALPVDTVSCSLAQALVAGLFFVSPEYDACQKKAPALGKITSAEFGTEPFAFTVTAAGLGCGPAGVVQVLFVKTWYVTVPLGVPAAPLIVAESCTDPPGEIDEADRLVAIVGFPLFTVTCSLVQRLVSALLSASPE
jgi:hypothetical protein